MEVVSENSEAEIARGRASTRLEYPLRDLAANMLRVIRGAGKPHMLAAQMLEVLQIMQEYREASGYLPPPDEIKAILDIELPDSLLENISEFEFREVDAERDMIRGALQIAASRLLGQLTQERTGDAELSKGFRAREKLSEDRRRAHAKEMREAAQRAKPKRRTVRKVSRKAAKPVSKVP
jgi:hypothetical protein